MLALKTVWRTLKLLMNSYSIFALGLSLFMGTLPGVGERAGERVSESAGERDIGWVGVGAWWCQCMSEQGRPQWRMSVGRTVDAIDDLGISIPAAALLYLCVLEVEEVIEPREELGT